MSRRPRQLMTEADMAAILAEPRNLERWRARLSRYTDPGACWIFGEYERAAGSFSVVINGERRAILAPRMSLMVKLGRPLRDGYFACHACDRPGCVNPACLWEGTHTDNMRDASAKGRLRTHARETRWHIERKRQSIAFYERRLNAARRRLAELLDEDARETAREVATPPARPMQFGVAERRANWSTHGTEERPAC